MGGESSRLMSLHLTDPSVDLMVFENATIRDNCLQIPPALAERTFMPTMYKSWTAPQVDYLEYDVVDSPLMDAPRGDVLFIFDTWGCSSYYHLLIDHLIPLWITKDIVADWLGFDPATTDYQYLRISDNNYPKELPNTRDIFRHVFDKDFVASVTGSFKYIVYGYCYTYRPFHRIEESSPYFASYQRYLDRFVENFSLASDLAGPFNPTILFPLRSVRSNPFVDFFYERYKNEFDFQRVDFGQMSFAEQITVCGSAWCMFGSEGASFANQVFMPRGGLVICINHNPIFGFQSAISPYMGHDFHGFLVVDPSEYEASGESVAQLIRSEIATRRVALR